MQIRGSIPEFRINVTMCGLKQPQFDGHFGDDKWSGTVRVSNDEEIGGSLPELDYRPALGEVETIRTPIE